MYQKFRYRIAVFFAILFITIVSAPTIILSIDDSVDATIFLGENDEEEKENMKLLFDVLPQILKSKISISHQKTVMHILSRNTPNHI